MNLMGKLFWTTQTVHRFNFNGEQRWRLIIIAAEKWNGAMKLDLLYDFKQKIVYLGSYFPIFFFHWKLSHKQTHSIGFYVKIAMNIQQT